MRPPLVSVIGGVQVDVVMTPVSELPPAGHTLHVSGMNMRVGGAAANAAFAFAELATPIRLMGCVGDDHLGGWLLEQLAPLGLGGEVNVVASDTTGLTVCCEGPGRDRTFLTYLGVNERWELAMLPGDATSPPNLLVCDYFCAPALRGEATARLLGAARANGAMTFFDTAWDAAGFQPQTRQEVLELLPLVDVFLPNEAEARAITAERGPLPEAARTLQAASGGWVAVKLGARGCLAVGPGGQEFRAPAAAREIADSTGAGDAFNAGLIAALAGGRQWPQALEAASELAGRILSRPSGERHLTGGHAHARGVPAGDADHG